MQMYKLVQRYLERPADDTEYMIDFGEQYKYYLKFNRNSHGIIEKQIFNEQMKRNKVNGNLISYNKINPSEVDIILMRNQIVYALKDNPGSAWKEALRLN